MPQQGSASESSALTNGADQPCNGQTSGCIPPGLEHQDRQQQSEQRQDSTMLKSAAQQQEAKDEQQRDSSAQQLQGWILSPQEVLQELLGDLFITQERLVMGRLSDSAPTCTQHSNCTGQQPSSHTLLSPLALPLITDGPRRSGSG